MSVSEEAKAQALQFKAAGNKFFSAGQYESAIPEFSKAIDLNPHDHVFYSNRSACYAGLKRYAEALEDAEQCIATKPTWAKGYTRKGLALFEMKKLDEAKECYEAGLKIDPNNSGLKEGLSAVQRSQAGPKANPLSQMFGESMWSKLAMNPQTRGYLDDPEFVQQLKQLQTNPQAMGAALGGDPRMTQCLSVILGIPLGGADSGVKVMNDPIPKPGDQKTNPSESSTAMEDEESSDDDMPEAEEVEIEKTPEELEDERLMREEKEEEERLAREKADLEAKADDIKNQGNTAYKAKDFASAHTFYDQAIEMLPTKISYRTNKSAVFLAEKKYDLCVACCQDAIKVGRENRADFKTIAKAYNRMGKAYTLAGRLEEAIQAYEDSLLENKTTEASRELRKIKNKKEKRDKAAYLSPEKSEEEKQAGNDLFKEQKWAAAIEHYSEALKRDPNNYKVYSNRAACYTKLMDWGRALDDCEKCIKANPEFVKPYLRKGKVQHFLKQYHKALETYETALAIDPTATEIIQARQETMMAVRAGGNDPERAREAMKDPEIQAIMNDPMISSILQQMQTNPQSAQAALRDPDVMKKINKLVAAGVLQMG